MYTKITGTTLFKTYKQTRDTSCGPSCVMMALNHFIPGNILLNRATEHRLHDRIGWKQMNGSTLPASICKVFIYYKLHVYYHAHIQGTSQGILGMYLQKDDQIRATIHDHKFHYERKEFKEHLLFRHLHYDRLILVPINLGTPDKVQLHWILLLKKSLVGEVHFADPEDGKIKICTPKKLKKLMTLPIGKVFIAVGLD